MFLLKYPVWGNDPDDPALSLMPFINDLMAVIDFGVEIRLNQDSEDFGFFTR